MNQPIIEHREPLRPGQMWSKVIKRGEHLRLLDLEGRAQVAALFFNARDYLERYNMPDTLKAQHIARLTVGSALYSDMGRVLMAIVEDTVGWHDTITGHATRISTLQKYGTGDYQELRNTYFRNTRDNFLIELGKYGMGLPDITANVNFFVKVVVDEQGNLQWAPNPAKPAAYVELRAEMDTLVVLSNTPHPLDPSPHYHPAPAELVLRQGLPESTARVCRTSCEENGRGFLLTEDYVR